MVFMESLQATLQDTYDYKTDFRTLLLDEILNFAWFSHRQALNNHKTSEFIGAVRHRIYCNVHGVG